MHPGLNPLEKRIAMTPRERVTAALNHREPDRIPIDLGATMCSSLTLKANNSLKSYLGKPLTEELITNPLTDSVALTEDLLQLFGIDFRTVRMKGPEGIETEIDETGETITDEFGTVWKRAEYDYVPFIFSYGEAELSDLKNLPEPDPYNPGRVRGIRQEAEKLRNETEYAVVADFICGGPFEQAQRIRGFEQFMVDMHTDPDFSRALLTKLTDNAIGLWDAMLSEVGEYVDVVCQGDDLGMQNGLQISPEMYRKFIKPCHKRLFDFMHSKTAGKVWLHSCGSVYDIIPDLIDVGVEALNPIQTKAKNMELPLLKREFGNEITIWGGGIDIQILPFMKTEEIEKEVTKVMELMAPGGGYVFAASHNILPDTSGENIYTAYQTANQRRSK